MAAICEYSPTTGRVWTHRQLCAPSDLKAVPIARLSPSAAQSGTPKDRITAMEIAYATTSRFIVAYAAKIIDPDKDTQSIPIARRRPGGGAHAETMAAAVCVCGLEPAGLEPAGLDGLPPEVLYKVLADDQTGRMACMLASRGLYRALHTPAVWTSIHFDQLEPRALDFLRFAKECRQLSLATESADDALWFLESAAATCPALQTSLTGLRLRVTGGLPVPAGLAAALTAFPALESVAVDLARAEVSDTRFGDAPAGPRGCPRLTSFSWIEAADDAGERGCHVSGMPWLATYAPALADIHVEARTCDVLDPGRGFFAAARRVTYLGSHEAYEHARLGDVDLDELRLHVHPESDRWRLVTELSRARRIGRLRLTVDVDDLDLLARLPVEELVLDSESIDVRVNLDYDVVARWLPRVRVAVADGLEGSSLVVRFLGMDVTRLREFAAWAEQSLDAESPRVTIVLERGFA